LLIMPEFVLKLLKRKKHCLLKKEISFPIIIFLILVCFSFIWTPSLVEAQEREIVTAKTLISRDGIHPGESFKVAFVLNIVSGWHINGPRPDNEFLIPSELIIDENDNIRVLSLHYPKPESARFDYSEAEVPVYDGEILLGALIKVSDDIALKKHFLKGSFLYQPCDDRSCMAPKALELEIPFQVVPLSKKTEEINKEIFSKLDIGKEGK
jgi:thiol:disulfide interchange protein DsbD